jgi:hypothetical protein
MVFLMNPLTTSNLDQTLQNLFINFMISPPGSNHLALHAAVISLYWDLCSSNNHGGQDCGASFSWTHFLSFFACYCDSAWNVMFDGTSSQEHVRNQPWSPRASDSCRGVIDVFCNHFSKDYFGDGVAAGDRRKTMIKELAASYRNDCGLISPHDSFWNIGTLGVCRSSIKLRSTFCTARAYRSSYVVLQRFYFWSLAGVCHIAIGLASVFTTNMNS